MIGKLSGIIDSFDSDHLILDVGGVGYIVFVSTQTLSSIGQVGDAVSLLITTQVREDSFTLYGFANSMEKQWFTLLTSVQGVGAKAGLAILAICPADQLGFAIASQDKTALTRASGVGPKLATRILTELKDKAGKIEISLDAQSVTAVHGGSNDPEMTPICTNLDQDAVSALTNLGYASSDAYKAVMQAKKQDEKSDLGTLIRLSLQELSA